VKESRSVLAVHASDEGYGADRVLLQVLLGLRERGWQVAVLVPDDNRPGWLSTTLAANGVPVRRAALAIARRRHFQLFALPAYARALWRARRTIRTEAKRVHASIIHVNTSALPVAAILGRPGGARLVWQVHELIVRPRAMAWIFRVLPPLTADRVIAVSEAVRLHLLPRGPWRRRVVTVHNGIANNRPEPMPGLRNEGRPLVAFVGRLNRWKGYELFIEAVARIAPSQPFVDFVIAGDAPRGEGWRVDDLRKRLEDAGLADRVRTLGLVPDGAAVAEAADIVVIPSTWPEPFGLVALEAMRAGRVVVAAAHGGIPEIVEDGVSGVLVPPRDPAGLAAAIGGLLDDPARMASLGAAAQARVRTEFSVERMVDQVERIYLELLA
jgi:glycosyltransferase involved in cell wall biosynthesis